jgi:hypothetical protein
VKKRHHTFQFHRVAVKRDVKWESRIQRVVRTEADDDQADARTIGLLFSFRKQLMTSYRHEEINRLVVDTHLSKDDGAPRAVVTSETAIHNIQLSDIGRCFPNQQVFTNVAGGRPYQRVVWRAHYCSSCIR